MNRAERRQAERAEEARKRQEKIDRERAEMRGKTPLEKRTIRNDRKVVESIARNGITLQDLEYQFKRGVEQGWRDGADNCMKMCYAGFILALKEELDLEGERCMEILRKADWFVTYSLSGEEAIDEVYRKAGCRLDFKEALPDERISQEA